MKACSKCKVMMPLTFFYNDNRRSDGKQSQCKGCFKDRNEKNSEKRKSYMKSWRKENEDHVKSYTKKYYDENCETIKESAKKYHHANSDRLKARMAARYWSNPEGNRDRVKQWRQNNPSKINAINARRRSNKIKATPAWANLEAIQIEYDLADWCSKVTGEKYHVDHIIPLNGHNVCGLHVHTNLQVIRGVDNISKSNKFEVTT